MKKLIIIGVILMIVFYSQKSEPDYSEAIRLRIVPNSNSSLDRDVKSTVEQNIQTELLKVISINDSKETVRTKLKNNLDNFDNLVKKTFLEKEYYQNYNINYGMNYFPEKEFNNIKIPAGEYESLVITLGEGKGDNWWCFLFPPLCLLEAQEENADKIEYDFYFSKLINKIFK